MAQEDLKTKNITPLCFASYPLTATEARYPQIDREALSIYWAIKRFHLYLYGKEFKVITDHAPLVSLFNNPVSKPTARIEDQVLQAVMFAVKSGNWHKPPQNVSLAELSRYENTKDDLTCSDTVILKSNRLVIPSALQERVVDLAHEGHQGIGKTKALLREKVWFPCMDKLVETKVKSCLACQIATPVITREPLLMTKLPNGPFDEINIDFAHVDGETLLLLVDDYSRFPVVETVSSTSAAAVIPKLDATFATFGTPYVVKSDNGPPFCGEEFAKFAKVLGFRHRKVTPLWPRANGEVERFVKTLKKCVKTSKAQCLNWRKEVQGFLRNYRTTPHVTTNVPPASLFLKREIRNKLPQLDKVNDDTAVRQRNAKQKLKMKSYADSKNYVKPSQIKMGDQVIVQRPFNHSKSDTPYNPDPMTVTDRKGSMITARSSKDGQHVTRNSSFFKKINTCLTMDKIILNWRPVPKFYLGIMLTFL